MISLKIFNSKTKLVSWLKDKVKSDFHLQYDLVLKL